MAKEFRELSQVAQNIVLYAKNDCEFTPIGARYINTVVQHTLWSKIPTEEALRDYAQAEISSMIEAILNKRDCGGQATLDDKKDALNYIIASILDVAIGEFMAYYN